MPVFFAIFHRSLLNMSFVPTSDNVVVSFCPFYQKHALLGASCYFLRSAFRPDLDRGATDRPRPPYPSPLSVSLIRFSDLHRFI